MVCSIWREFPTRVRAGVVPNFAKKHFRWTEQRIMKSERENPRAQAVGIRHFLKNTILTSSVRIGQRFPAQFRIAVAPELSDTLP